MMITETTSRGHRNKKKVRVGRGTGSGLGKTSGRGTKGQGQHATNFPHILREGGQMPLYRRIPKRGFSNAKFRVEYQVVNVADLNEHFEAGAKIDAESLKDKGLIGHANRPVKILATGEISKSLQVTANAFSTAAAEKIAKAGGQTTVIGAQAQEDAGTQD